MKPHSRRPTDPARSPDDDDLFHVTTFLKKIQK
jgi:hypothetical protein